MNASLRNWNLRSRSPRPFRPSTGSPTPTKLILICATSLVAAGCGPSPKPTDNSARSTTEPEWFRDITATSGVSFHHVVGTNYFMPDQIGGGVAILDYDGDGRLDLYLVQNGGRDSQAPNQLFHQEADGTFRNVSAGSGVDVSGSGMGAIAGDVNNDGRPDLVVTEYGAVRLFQNLGAGKFLEVTAAAGLDNPHWAVPASLVDYDRDGWLDLVVGNYVDYNPTHRCVDPRGIEDFCAPRTFGPTVTRLWRNVTQQPGGAPRFEDRTESAGFTRAPGVALGLVCADFDGDGWPDVFCSDDERPNRLFINQRDGTFVEQAAIRGLAFNAMGGTSANMGTAFGDVDGDGLADLFVTHLSEEFHSLWKQGPRGSYLDQVATAGLQQQAWRGTGFGTVLADFNADGALDLVIANGLVRRLSPGQTPAVPGLDPWWARYAQRTQLFRNDGSGHFQDLSPSNHALCGQALVGRGLAVGDLNNDGAPDSVISGPGGPARIYRNIAANHGHWLRVRLLDPEHGNRDAVGAELVVRAGSRRWWLLAQPATSYLSSNDPILHLGLGPVTSVDQLEVLWPDGKRESFAGGRADELRVLRKGTGP